MSNDINTQSQAYNTGFEARNQGEPKSSCPYAAGTVDAINWIAGWADAA
jgi:ribosome modulation factor